MLFSDGFHDEQSQARSFDVRQRATAHAIKAAEDSFQLLGSDSNSAILHFEHDSLFVRRLQLYLHIDVIAGILHRILKHIRNRDS